MPKQGKASHVANAFYDEGKGTLTVIFDNGATYEYYGISKNLYEAFLSDGLSGSFLHANIKGKYRYARV